MEHWIRTVAEPRRLILTWQAPDQFGPANRTRWAVGVVERQDSTATFRYLSSEEFGLFNPGRSLEQLMSFGYRGYPAFRQKDEKQIFDAGVLATFLRRLPPRSRPDFSSYLRSFRVDPAAAMSDFALLGITEAKLPSDGFSLVDPLDARLLTCDLMLEIAGYRYYARKLLKDPSVGDLVSIEEDPDKTYEPHAVAVYLGDAKIGNINRLQAPTFISWLADRRLSAVVERVNGTPERPRLHIFVQVRPIGQAAQVLPQDVLQHWA